MSSPERGSSSSSTRGSLASARPTSTRRRMPSGNAATGAFSTLVSRNSSSNSSTRSLSSLEGGNNERGSNMSRQRRRGATRARWASIRCSRTVSPKKSSGCWNVRAKPFLARARHDALVTSSPRRCTCPAFGRRRPERTARSVDLPAPFGPTRPAMRPGCTSRLTCERAVRPPKRTVISLAARAASPAPAGTSAVCVSPGADITRCAPPRASLPPDPGRLLGGSGLPPRCLPGAVANAEPTVEAGDFARPGCRPDTWPP